MNLDNSSLRRHFINAGIAFFGENVRGGQTMLPYGWAIRNKLYSIGIRLAKEQGFFEMSLSDMVAPEDLLLIDRIVPISKNYPYVDAGGFHMAAGHEIPAYLFARAYFKYFPRTALPFNFFQIGSVYRYPRNAKYPFNYGERKSFLECYSIHDTSASAESFLPIGYEWNRTLIQGILKLPSIEAERPLISNKPVSRKTVCIDSLTPLGATVITGMTYFHDDIFTRALGVKIKNPATGRNNVVSSVHFGVSDNILFAYLLNSHDEKGFYLLSMVAPYPVSIILGGSSRECSESIKKILDFLKDKKIDYEKKTVRLGKVAKAIVQNELRGIPLTILVSHSAEKGLEINAMTRMQNRFTPLDSVEMIETLLKKNDEAIWNKFQALQDSNIKKCDSIEEVNAVVQTGKVAEVFMDARDENVVRCESRLKGGEILGFRDGGRLSGEDILTGRKSSMLAFVSRRI